MTTLKTAARETSRTSPVDKIPGTSLNIHRSIDQSMQPKTKKCVKSCLDFAGFFVVCVMR